MEFVLGAIIPYMAGTVFIAGTVLKVAGWFKTPVPFCLTLFPLPANAAERIRAFISDYLLFSTLFREDKALWLRAWMFHLSLALIIAGHAVGIFFLREQFTLLGSDPAASHFLSRFLGATSGILMVFSLGALIIGRIVNPAVRRLSAPEDYFNLFLLGAIALSGLLMYFPVFHVDLPAVRAYLGGILLLRPSPLPPSPLFVTHFLLVNLLLIYFPFSRFLHPAGYFVNRAMLTEDPPVYPTAVGTAPRSPFATSKAHTHMFISRKEARDTEASNP